MKRKFLALSLFGAMCCMALGLVACGQEPYDPSQDSSSVVHVHTHTFDNSCDETCNGCDYTRNVVHSYTMLKYSKTEHWYECACGEVSEQTRTAHEGGEATCTKRAVCVVCEKAYGETAAHRSSGVGIGYPEERCLDCGYLIAPSVLRTLVFYSNGGTEVPYFTGTQQDVQVLENTGMMPVPEKEGYAFEGWYFDEACTQPFMAEALAGDIIPLYANYLAHEYKVQLKFSHPNACGVEGEEVQTVSAEQDFAPVTVTPFLGYVFDYYEVEGTRYKSNVIEVPFLNKPLDVTVVMDYATYELPIVNLASASAPSKEDIDIKFSLDNCAGAAELQSLQGKLREKLTDNNPKKTYYVTFDTPQKLLGTKEAKEWALLAEYFTPSGLRNYTALTLGGASSVFAPTPYKVNLYIGGGYMGIYTLCQNVGESEELFDINPLPTNVNISDYATFLSNCDFCIRIEQVKSYDESLPYVEENGVAYFNIDTQTKQFEKRAIELRYPTKQDFATEGEFATYVGHVKRYVEDIFESIRTGTKTDLENKLDIDSLIDNYILDSIMIERSHHWSSFTMTYQANTGKLRFGPIWDYDICINEEYVALNKPNENYDYNAGYAPVNGIYYSTFFYTVFERIPELEQAVKVRYNERFKAKFGEFIDGYDLLLYTMKESYALNGERWYGGYSYDITQKNVEFFGSYLQARKAYLDSVWSI